MSGEAVENGPAITSDSLSRPEESPEQRPHARAGRYKAESELIFDVLMLCASSFETGRARFVRQSTNGEWHVHSIQHDALVMHRADYAEVAMAWAVGLSRFPIRVTRPRITQPDGSATRPIAVSSYVGIPVLCRDHFVGVIEMAGHITADLERTLDRLGGALQLFGNRLTHDPSLRSAQPIDLDTECWIDGGCWTSTSIDLSEEEWTLIAAIGERALLRDVVERVPFGGQRVIDLVQSLVCRGVVSARVSTRPLSEQHVPEKIRIAAMAAGND